MGEQPLVSVLMTAFNREKYIAEAIESVLASTYTNFELIIVDDCSSDRTVEISKNYVEQDMRVKLYINEHNLGDYPNRNKAAGYAQGKYLKYVDADDCIYYYGLEVMVNYMEKFPEAALGLCTTFKSCKLPVMITPHEIYFNFFLNDFDHLDSPPISAIFKNETFKILGGFSGERLISDSEFLCRICRFYKIVILPPSLYYYRIHDEQEAQSDYAKKYFVLRNKVFSDALSDEECPLTEKEIKAARKRMEKIKLKVKFSEYKKLIFRR